MAGIEVKGRTALITGSSRGIGRGIALKLAQCGVGQIAVHYLKNKEVAEETARLLREIGAEPLLIQADVTRPEDILRMFAEVRGGLSSLDIFVANARPDVQEFYRSVLDLSAGNWRAAIDSQATALLLCAREAAGMMERGGRIIAVTYAGGAQTGSWRPWAAIGPAKAAMESLLRYLAWELAERGIAANAVSPGATEDSVFSTLPPEVLGVLREWAGAGWVPMRRLATPADVGNVVALLCSEQAGFVTGQTLHVDGGASLASPDFPMEFQRGA
ncbi:SDR family oxidoreductase [Paracraurococcus lichenis]|uniref:SDR family oxidoreductase n=1 Tax=Paracraurococcus lichenis TaxID=3064888 RepID=A0ABT9EAW9_9PROT|nr:SDR family oxidoreductase [Paracraurococcus sp. LOR1-02]MDO9713349.1 SDR family oxidoreductase [Paracraurococcus sp. LOR1-02]